MIFENAIYLWLLPALLFLYLWKKKFNNRITIKFPNVQRLKNLESPTLRLLNQSSTLIKYLILAFIILALSRPQLIDYSKQRHMEGIDIQLIIDTSISMNAEDLKPNRLKVAKDTIDEFISERESDRIGLITFGEFAYTKAPLTIDYNVVSSQLNNSSTGESGNGTAIGLAISTGLNRLKNSVSKNKVMILLTDGENNTGGIEPLQAAKLAKELKVKIYTIGVGKKSGAYIPIYNPRLGKRYIRDPNTGWRLKTKLDEATLKEIAAVSNGKYFHADNRDTLTLIYKEINELEKTKIKVKQYHNITELFPLCIWIAFLLLIMESIISSVFLVTIP